jgi:hypothetical protein
MWAVLILAVLGMPVLIALSSIWRGYVLTVLWGWFIVPAFGAHPLSVPLAIGISMLVGMLTMHKNGKEAEKEMGAGTAIATSVGLAVLVPLAALGSGWVVHLFV